MIREETDRLTSEYLDTVEKRARLTSSMDSLVMLNKEVCQSPNIFTYRNNTYERCMQLKWYIEGKYDGIKSTKINNENL